MFDWLLAYRSFESLSRSEGNAVLLRHLCDGKCHWIGFCSNVASTICESLIILLITSFWSQYPFRSVACFSVLGWGQKLPHHRFFLPKMFQQISEEALLCLGSCGYDHFILLVQKHFSQISQDCLWNSAWVFCEFSTARRWKCCLAFAIGLGFFACRAFSHWNLLLPRSVIS